MSARSAERRSAGLAGAPGGVCPQRASNTGAPENPGWYYNLEATPRIDVEVGAETFPVVVEEIMGEERD